jgi:glycolate oxidase FAD binding subunit
VNAAAARVVEATTAADVAATLQQCARDRAAIVVHGGDTLQAIGNAPARCDVALRLATLRGIRDYDPRELTFGADAGTTLAEISRELGREGQFVPFDAPFPERATVGGTLAAGWLGPRRARYGRLRDLVIGSTVALTDGTLAHAGGMVVKNVTGYDMSKLYVGALGTLGVIVRANFKALPRPPARRLAIAPLADAAARAHAIELLAQLAIEPSAILAVAGFRRVLTRYDADVRLAVLVEGSEAVVERGTRELRSTLGRAGVAETFLLDAEDAERTFAAIVDAYVEPLDDRSITYRSTGLPSTAWERAIAAARVAAARGAITETIADIRTGDAIVRLSGHSAADLAADLPELDAALRAAVPRSIVIAGAPALRARVDAWGAPPATLDTMRALKARFDPAGILAPGRFVGGI